MATLFISDLHLHPKRPETIQLFLKFMQSTRRMDALYILGDFFEVWVGDDEIHPAYLPVIEMLHKVSTQLPIYWMHGNRDFLVGQKFFDLTGCRLLSDPTVVVLYGNPVFLTHGDQLCSNDLAYQRYRCIAQHPITKRLFLSLPISMRRSIANVLRQRSGKKTNTQAQYEICETAIFDFLEKYPHVQQMIHGHVHIPGKHQHRFSERQIDRMVLGEWHLKNSTIGVYLPNGEMHLEAFS